MEKKKTNMEKEEDFDSSWTYIYGNVLSSYSHVCESAAATWELCTYLCPEVVLKPN